MLHTLKQIELGEHQHHCEIYNRATQTHCNDIKSRQTAPIRAPYILNVLLVSSVTFFFISILDGGYKHFLGKNINSHQLELH